VGDTLLPDPSTLVWPTGQPLPSPTISPPKTIVVKGTEVMLPAGVKVVHPWQLLVGWDIESSLRITYRSSPEVELFSWLTLDGSGSIIASHVRPEDMAVFQPVLDAAGPPLAPVITIAGETVQLAPGMRVGESAYCRDPKVYIIEYDPIPARPIGSFMTIAEDGTILKQSIAPADTPVFQALLDVAKPAE
jgi:hypothetical protein